MRALAIACLAAMVLGGCASSAVVTPRKYLDEQTGATITAVAEPWVFNRERSAPQLDFINMYAIDINRMGEHRQYLVVVQYWPAPEWKAAQPLLEIQAADDRVRLQPIDTTARELGIGQPLDPSAPRAAKYWFYPVERAQLERIARTQHTSVALLKDEVRASYIVWRDGSAELNEFATFALD
jgi:hypothetical protein